MQTDIFKNTLIVFLSIYAGRKDVKCRLKCLECIMSNQKLNCKKWEKANEKLFVLFVQYPCKPFEYLFTLHFKTCVRIKNDLHDNR